MRNNVLEIADSNPSILNWDYINSHNVDLLSEEDIKKLIKHLSISNILKHRKFGEDFYIWMSGYIMDKILLRLRYLAQHLWGCLLLYKCFLHHFYKVQKGSSSYMRT